MPTVNGVWVPDLFGKQWDIFNCTKRVTLVSGSRLSGKSTGCYHRIVRHLWETKNARVGFFAKSQKLAKDGGGWQELIEDTIPQWVDANIGFEFLTENRDGVPGPKQDAQTRTPYFQVKNVWGGRSEAKLFSIDNDHEVESKVKSKAFSMIFFSELSMFKDRFVLQASLPSLRHIKIPPGQPDVYQMWLGDTNPDVHEGDQAWFYKLWYEERLAASNDPDVRRFREGLHLIEMFLEDNPYATPEQIADLKGSCDGDPDKYASYVEGKHAAGGKTRTRLFSSFFSEPVHVIGGREGEKDQIEVHSDTSELYSGWDLGSSVNHAAVILEKYPRMVEGKVMSCWSVLNEMVFIGEKIGLEQLTRNFLEQMNELEEEYKRKFEWYHWTDSSATTVWRASSQSYDYMEILAASTDRKNIHGPNGILLMGVEKPKHSIDARIRLLRKYLRQERIFISSRCHAVISMLNLAKRGDSDSEPILRDRHSHVFDALTYPIFMEARDELMEIHEKPRAALVEGEDYASV